VHEVADQGLRAALPDQVPDEVEVVVVQQDEGLTAGRLDLLDHRRGGQLVGHHVAVLEGRPLLAAERRAGLQVVQAVLHEPQQRVRDDAVERLVHLGRDVQQAHAHLPLRGGVVRQHPRLALERQPERPAVHLRGDRLVLRPAGDTHPHGVVEVPGQAGQRGDQATGAAAGRAAAGGVAVEGHRAAVGQQDHRVQRGGEG
jgi:hypothetical protein